MRERTQSFDPRQTMQRNTFEIFHYHDRRPSGVLLHHHDFYEVYYFLDGQMDYRVEGRIYHLQPGDLLLIGPLEFHQPVPAGDEDPVERIVLWIDRSYLEHFTTADSSLTRCFDTSRPEHTNLLRLSAAQRTDFTLKMGELLRESYGPDYASNLCSEGILLQLMVELNRVAIRTEETQTQQESSALVSQVLQYISEHYNEELSLDSLAGQFYVSKYHLSHEFSRVVGTGVYRYILLKRLQIARQMLAAGIAPGAVCEHCGFGDYANFYRAFKSQYGISPRSCAKPER